MYLRNLVGAALLSLTLAGCATQFGTITKGIDTLTKSVTNPVTKSDEAQIELALDSAIVVLKGYKTACINGTADANCKANVARVQAYTRQMPPLLAQLRNFVDSNDQINAIVVYNQFTTLYANFKTTAASLGYNVGNLP